MNYLIFAAFLSIASMWFTFNLARKTGICPNFFEIVSTEAKEIIFKTRERLYFLSLISWTSALMFFLLYLDKTTTPDTRKFNMMFAVFSVTCLILILPYKVGHDIRKKDPYYKAI
jgi:hypothetical protein